MIKETIKYTNFNGTESTTDLYFNLTRLDAAKIIRKFGSPEDFQARIMDIAKSGDPLAMLDLLEYVIEMSYGVKSADGQHFSKSQAVVEDFKSSAAYEAFLEKLISQDGYIQDFFGRLVPESKDAMKKVAATADEVERVGDPSIIDLPKAAEPLAH